MIDELKVPWWEYARCAQPDVDPELFFPPQGASPREALMVCHTCHVRIQCLNWALRHRNVHGVWGGMTERERRSLRQLALEACVE